MSTLSAEAVAFAKQSFHDRSFEAAIAHDPRLIKQKELVLHGIAKNVKKQPGGFVATSGVVLPYYLDLSTNFMDPTVAPHIIVLMISSLKVMRLKLIEEKRFVAEGHNGVPNKLLVIGMEVAGGMMISQLAAMAETVDPSVPYLFDFLYMRKERKKTGTAKQLEGLRKYTDRTPDSAPIAAIWIDDANSTGSSLKSGCEVLEADYNINVVSAVYLVDRSIDRANLPEDKMHYASERFVSKKTTVHAVFDLQEIDAQVRHDSDMILPPL